MRSATPDEASALGITTGAPILNVFLSGHDASGDALHLIDAVLPGDRHELRDVYPLS